MVSWDGAGALDDGLFPRFRKIAADTKCTMTFFLSGLYLLPESKKRLYRPPNNPVGASAIGYLTDAHIRATLGQLAAAWKEGHEIGTHFNGHFCSGSGTVARWTPAQWHSEIEQAMAFVSRWKTNTGFSGIDPLPFDYAKELTGGRTPCLLGQDNLLPTAKALGWRYDASSPGGIQTWPRRRGGLWDFPLQALPFPGHSFEVLSMDYNMMANQSGNSTQGAKSSRPGWRDQARKAYLAGFDRAYKGNRAPLFIGNHFEHWNGGIYMDAVQDVIEHIAGQPEVEMVSFRQMCDWLDAQDPAVLTALQSLNVGKAPGFRLAAPDHGLTTHRRLPAGPLPAGIPVAAHSAAQMSGRESRTPPRRTRGRRSSGCPGARSRHRLSTRPMHCCANGGHHHVAARRCAEPLLKA